MKKLKAWLIRWRLGIYEEHLAQIRADYRATTKALEKRLDHMRSQLQELEA